MRRAARVDDNQAAIVDACRKAGATVQVLSAVGKGCPDLLVGICGRNLLLEVKDGAKKPSARKLTTDETLWHMDWRGHVAVVETPEQAVQLVRSAIAEKWL